MIVFEKVRYKNFLSAGNKPIEIVLNRSPITIVTGQNGSGKSAGIIDAIFFALYGKAYRKIKKDQLVNSINRKNLLVELEFSVGNTKYKVVRGIKPSVFDIYINGKKRKGSASLRDNQTWLETNVLKMNSTTMRQIVFLGSTSFIPFMRLSAAERRNVIEEVLDIKIFSVMLQIAKQKMSTLSQRYSTLSNERVVVERELSLKKEHYEEMVARDKNQHSELVMKLERAQADVEQIEQKIEECSHEIEVLEARIADKQNIVNGLSEANGVLSKLEARLKQLRRAIGFFSDNTQCPLCKNSLEEDYRHSHIQTYDAQISELEQSIMKAEKYRNTIEARLREIEEIERELSRLKITKHGYETSHKALVADVEEYKKSIKEFEECSSETKEKIENDIESLETKLNDINSKLEQISNLGEYYKVASVLLKDDGVKSQIISTYLPTINSLIRKYLEILEFACEFSFNEEFEETIKSRYRDTFSYGNFSEGQKMRIDLALLFTWRELAKLKNRASTNLLVLDEIGSSSLDSNGTDAFIRIIRESDEGNNVFIISHDKAIIDRGEFDVIEYSLRNNFSAVKTSFE